ncbi:hypothetical protein BD309DRAFT_220320 [Dichomitus squalens]|uniref:Uncharacterized protein n=1 Tax=Dichomitus squalens TaxID=114155 RepID=A0A4Q9NMV3_9APHY|nr:hypothetical protein BD309DRAFT_220320 [Dichomitus squalens]TBU61414.1 hypothetical protein BD310DRAFT_194593 [Dichomitus squalens]
MVIVSRSGSVVYLKSELFRCVRQSRACRGGKRPDICGTSCPPSSSESMQDHRLARRPIAISFVSLNKSVVYAKDIHCAGGKCRNKEERGETFCCFNVAEVMMPLQWDTLCGSMPPLCIYICLLRLLEILVTAKVFAGLECEIWNMSLAGCSSHSDSSMQGRAVAVFVELARMATPWPSKRKASSRTIEM